MANLFQKIKMRIDNASKLAKSFIRTVIFGCIIDVVIWSMYSGSPAGLSILFHYFSGSPLSDIGAGIVMYSIPFVGTAISEAASVGLPHALQITANRLIKTSNSNLSAEQSALLINQNTVTLRNNKLQKFLRWLTNELGPQFTNYFSRAYLFLPFIFSLAIFDALKSGPIYFSDFVTLFTHYTELFLGTTLGVSFLATFTIGKIRPFENALNVITLGISILAIYGIFGLTDISRSYLDQLVSYFSLQEFAMPFYEFVLPMAALVFSGEMLFHYRNRISLSKQINPHVNSLMPDSTSERLAAGIKRVEKIIGSTSLILLSTQAFRSGEVIGNLGGNMFLGQNVVKEVNTQAQLNQVDECFMAAGIVTVAPIALTKLTKISWQCIRFFGSQMNNDEKRQELLEQVDYQSDSWHEHKSFNQII